MDIFFDDRQGQDELFHKDQAVEENDEDEEVQHFGLDVEKLLDKIFTQKATNKKGKVDPNDIDLDEFERAMGWKKKHKKTKIDKAVKMMASEVSSVDKVLSKAILKPNFERLKRAPAFDLSDKKRKEIRKKRRDKTKGKNWYNLPATEMTEEIKHDLEVVQMRSALDPKHFYKKNDMKVLPKYFHIGKVVDTPLDYYNGRLTKKERKRTIVEELMADAQFSKYNKRKYKEIIDEKKKTQYKAYKHAKKLKRKGKNK